mgnify:CR=1 FL=1
MSKHRPLPVPREETMPRASEMCTQCHARLAKGAIVIVCRRKNGTRNGTFCSWKCQLQKEHEIYAQRDEEEANS